MKNAKKYVEDKDLKEAKLKPTCPYCGSDKMKFLTNHGGLKILRCESCGIRFQYGGGNAKNK